MGDRVTKNELRLLAFIALRDGEISEERCREITGCSRNEIRDEMMTRVGMYSPLREVTDHADALRTALERLVNAGSCGQANSETDMEYMGAMAHARRVLGEVGR